MTALTWSEALRVAAILYDPRTDAAGKALADKLLGAFMVSLPAGAGNRFVSEVVRTFDCEFRNRSSAE